MSSLLRKLTNSFGVHTRAHLIANVWRHRKVQPNHFRQITASCSRTSSMVDTWNLPRVIRSLEYMAPLSLADSWDNVGLLLEPTAPHPVRKLLLTNDLTEAVVTEAIELEVDLILSYHPPIFAPLKRLTSAGWKERCLIRCLENRIAVYSPHTCWDAFSGGVNDWLALAFLEGSQHYSDVVPITESKNVLCGGDTKRDYSTISEFKCTSPETYASVKDFLMSLDNGSRILNANIDEARGSYDLKVFLRCTEAKILSKILKDDFKDDYPETMESNLPKQIFGMGRLITLTYSLKLSEVVSRIKDHLKLENVRVAIGEGKTLDSAVSTIALCAGSGTSVFKELKQPVDVYWTGEMSHHDTLDVVQRGTSVILCEHSNTERGFLDHIQPRLSSMFNKNIQVIVSMTDHESLRVV